MIANPTLGLNAQALVVLVALANMTPDFAQKHSDSDELDIDFTTRAWYNGQEKGFIIQMGLPELASAVYIACAENQSSDDIVVYHWIGKFSDWRAKSWHNAEYFKRLRVHKVVEHVYRVLEKYYEELPKKT